MLTTRPALRALLGCDSVHVIERKVVVVVGIDLAFDLLSNCRQIHFRSLLRLEEVPVGGLIGARA